MRWLTPLLLLSLAHAAPSPADCARQPATCGCPTPFPGWVPYQVQWGLTRTEYRQVGPLRTQVCVTGDPEQSQFVDVALEGRKRALFEDLFSGHAPQIEFTPVANGVTVDARWRADPEAPVQRRRQTLTLDGPQSPPRDSVEPKPAAPAEKSHDAWLFWAATRGADQEPPAEKTDAFARVVCRYAWALQGEGRPGAGAALIDAVGRDVLDRLDRPSPCDGLSARLEKAPPATPDDVAWALERRAPALAMRVADTLDGAASPAVSARIAKALAELMSDPRAPDIATALTMDDGFAFAGLKLRLTEHFDALERIGAAAQDPDVLAALTERAPKRASAWRALGEALLATHAPSAQVRAAFAKAAALGGPKTPTMAAWLRVGPLRWRTVSGWQISEAIRFADLRACQRAVCRPGPLCADAAPDQPARCVTHAAAVAFAKTVGAQLPNAAQAKHWGGGGSAFWTASCTPESCTVMTAEGAVAAPPTVSTPHVGVRLVRPPR